MGVKQCILIKKFGLTKKFVWNDERLVRLQVGGVRRPRLVLGVVVGLAAAQIPPPGVLVVADQALVADTVNWGFRWKRNVNLKIDVQNILFKLVTNCKLKRLGIKVSSTFRNIPNNYITVSLSINFQIILVLKIIKNDSI